ncbi:cell cycle control protein 50B [Takifugu rubripes]|uniref:cell cycle control protein 50B n=1 Tax=Takifugu rubripes TaxID=31033 RepID=UPI000298F6F4|nr:cell cycle control protein 50A-like [Takifugu rubripes]XP_011616698.1 cell cycle control protein 50A-like [Takifugu rubripes]XP_011616701.1 cell cycle control protein 50A-like [Takifugu rubripes]|eukprot:XP_003962553.1 PREDICTED: cell cycle control protein 50A-like [Takifugu rubripes]
MVNEELANRPDNTAFTQQRLPAWQPMLSAGIVIPGFLLIGLAFIGIGVALFITSQSIQVLELDYTGEQPPSPCYKCSDPTVKNCVCNLEFSITTLFKGPVFFYYGLSNYFQNYRKYGVSRDDEQLYGDLDNFKSPSEYCAPYQYDSNDKPIVPCGSIANSMFNDTFKLYQRVNGTKKLVPFDGKGIAWWTDYNIKYRNPSISPLKNAFNGTVKPLMWPKPAYELDPNDPANNGFINQDFLVWMRTAALPDFRKLYRRITEGDYAEGLPAGTYVLEIAYNYPVLSFEGRKKVVLSNVSWMGGKNEFLGIAYLVIGSLCIVMSIVMLIVYAKFKFPEEE